MYLNTQVKSECCGCGACSEICPKKCIKMEKDRYGYVYPVVDKSNCINCKLCEKVCPFNKIIEKNDEIKKDIIYALERKEEKDILKSASGGAFGAIVNCLRKKNTVLVWGAAFDNELKLKHVCSYNDDDLYPIHKSKYLQSDVTRSFKQIKEQLTDGKKVLFSGTPCQVSALYNFLNNKNYDNLFTIDLVCHGVPNQEMFDKYISEKEKRIKDKIMIYQFREKVHKGNKWNSRNILIKTKNGKKIVESRYKNHFLRAYQAAIMNRESCYKCIFATNRRKGDITIGDLWGIKNFYSEMDANHGVSLVKINSNKGMSLLNELKESCNVYEIDSSKYLSLTKGAMKQPTISNKNRDKFLKIYEKKGFIKAINNTVPGFVEKIKSSVNPNFKSKIKKIIRRG